MSTIEKKAETVPAADSPITYAQAVELISQSLAALRIYVVESDITEAQDSIRAIVEKATF